jgi:hypothetical protein
MSNLTPCLQFRVLPELCCLFGWACSSEWKSRTAEIKFWKEIQEISFRRREWTNFTTRVCDSSHALEEGRNESAVFPDAENAYLAQPGANPKTFEFTATTPAL